MTEDGKDMIMSPVGEKDNKLRSYVVVSTKGGELLLNSHKRIIEIEEYLHMDEVKNL